MTGTTVVARRNNFLPVDTETSQLEFSDLGDIREPYNRGIATLSLRPVANRPDDGYHIHLTATFGSQVVKLRAGKTVFDVVFEIHEAEVLMRDLNTQLEYGSEYHEHNKILKDIKNEDTERVLERHRGVNVSSSAISAEISDNDRVTTRSSSRSVPINFDHASLRHVKIGNRKSEAYLHGREILDYCGWFAMPASFDDPSGVRADLVVEESWIKLKEPKTESQSALGKIWNKVSGSNLQEHKLKKELFADLLRQLSFLNLRSTHSGPQATLHSTAIVCIPTKDVDVLSIEHTAPKTIELDERVLIEFLECRPGKEKRMMSTIVRQASRNNKTQKSFIPHSAVLSALNAYEYLFSGEFNGKKKTKEYLESKFGRNEIKDLMSAGLARNVKGYIESVNLYTKVMVDHSFRIHLSKMPLFEFVREILSEDPELSPTEIGISAADFLHRNWKSTTHQSYGHRLRSWTAYTFGDLILDRSGRPLHHSLGELEKDRPRLGSPRFINSETLTRISEMKASGMTIAEMAKEFKISPETIRKFKRQNRDAWEQL